MSILHPTDITGSESPCLQSKTQSTPLPYATPSSTPPRWARLLIPPGLIYFPLLILYALFFCWDARLPDTLSAFILILGLVLFFLTTWAVRLLLAALLWRIYRLPRSTWLPRLTRFAIAFAIIAAVIAAYAFDLPSRACFYACEPTLRRAADAILLSPPPADPASPLPHAPPASSASTPAM